MESGDKIVMLAGYYNCHEIQSGDIVAYNFANTGNLFVKTLRAVP
jgi:hypothetical protein